MITRPSIAPALVDGALSRLEGQGHTVMQAQWFTIQARLVADLTEYLRANVGRSAVVTDQNGNHVEVCILLLSADDGPVLEHATESGEAQVFIRQVSILAGAEPNWDGDERVMRLLQA